MLQSHGDCIIKIKQTENKSNLTLSEGKFPNGHHVWLDPQCPHLSDPQCPYSFDPEFTPPFRHTPAHWHEAGEPQAGLPTNADWLDTTPGAIGPAAPTGRAHQKKGRLALEGNFRSVGEGLPAEPSLGWGAGVSAEHSWWGEQLALRPALRKAPILLATPPSLPPHAPAWTLTQALWGIPTPHAVTFTGQDGWVGQLEAGCTAVADAGSPAEVCALHDALQDGWGLPTQHSYTQGQRRCQHPHS